MDLQSYRDIRANNLSGGNKRKMSVALAMLGNPPLIFLDEPSTGVDPQAKRFMWDIVSKISTQRKKSSVIITTHSMEEAEALCTKMGIMVDGQFKCFGSSQHIKDKYGTGYEIEVKIKTLNEIETNQLLQQYGITSEKLDINECKKLLTTSGNHELIEELVKDGVGEEFYVQMTNGMRCNAAEFLRWQFVEGQGNKAIDYLMTKFKEFNIIEHYGTSWKFKVSREDYSIGFLFGLMEDIQVQFDISEYSIAQTTLEQIFNNFAAEADKDKGTNRKSTTTLRKRSTAKKNTNPQEKEL